MYKVLIVDDEVLVRVGLKTTIDWEANGFTVVAEASNGEQGYEQYKKHQPDVIITDIKMPKKDGLWLVEEVRKENRNTNILVLTCYDEFSYARKALKFGADDYILKSEVEDEELVAVMQSIKKKIDEYNKKKHIQVKDLLNINYVKRSIFVDMVKNDFKMDEDMLERCRNIEFPVMGSRLAFVCVSINDNGYSAGNEPNPLKRTDDAVLNILTDLFAEKDIEYLFMHHDKEDVFLLSSPGLSSIEINRIFTTAADSVKQYFDCILNIVCTDTFDSIAACRGIYKDFAEKAQILFYKEQVAVYLSRTDRISFSEPNVFSLKKLHNKQVVEAIGQEDTFTAMKLMNEISSYFVENNVIPGIVKIFYTNLVGDIFSSYGLFLENSKQIQNQQYYHYQIESSSHMKELKGLLNDFIGKVIDEITHMRCTNSKLLINKALNYINSHYQEKISLDDVAKELHLSKQYLCNTFKKETGENMSLYINKLRIDKAKELLLEPDGRIKEIFEEVGYSNQQYFSKVFKKITGITIMEYKERKTQRQGK